MNWAACHVASREEPPGLHKITSYIIHWCQKYPFCFKIAFSIRAFPSAHKHAVISCLLKNTFLTSHLPFSWSHISLFYITEKKFLESCLHSCFHFSPHLLPNPIQSDFILSFAFPHNLWRSSVIWHC